MTNVVGWNSEDLELFDLVEEVNQNFYDVLGVSQVRCWYVGNPTYNCTHSTPGREVLSSGDWWGQLTEKLEAVFDLPNLDSDS